MLLYPTLLGREAAPVVLCSGPSSPRGPLGKGGDRTLSVCRERLAGPWASRSREGLLGKTHVPGHAGG